MIAFARILSVLFILGAAGTALAQTEDGRPGAGKPSDDARLAWWRDGRFGMFIHWGPVALKGTEIGWSRGREVPVDEYDELYQRFNPTKFDADEWVRVAKAAGMKYIVITSKHHDGFCIWDSAYTNYDITATPFKRDILAELSAACRRHDVKFCVYYSVCDWYHRDYPTGSPGGKSEKPNPNMPRYVKYLRNQVAEIIEKYGPLGVVWFDGEWEKPWTVEYGDDLYRFLRELQPDLILNNRVSKRRHGMAGTTRQGAGNPGDYDTPEQRVGSFNRERPWETCMTICRQWAWKPKDQMKSLKQCIQTLVQVAGGDGNFLFNVGPMPDGRIEPRQVERLREIGRWLDKYGESIYGTRGGPFKPNRWAVSTCRDDRVFLHVLRWPEQGILTLPAIPAQITGASLLGGGHVQVRQRLDGIDVTVPTADRDEIDTVVILHLDGSAAEIEPLNWRVPSDSLAFGKPATASNTFEKQSQYAPANAVDDDPTTRWATDFGTKQAWLAVDLGEPLTFGRVRITEAVEYGQRIKHFELQYKAGDEWRTFYSGTKIGADFSASFEPVTAQQVRLNILEASEGPTIWEFQLFARHSATSLSPRTTIPVPSNENRAAVAGWREGGTWLDQHADINRIGETRPLDVVFLGDSITQSWGGLGRKVGAPGGQVWERYFGDMRAANFGISGDQTQHILWRIDHGNFDRIDPRVIVLMIGTNNLAHDEPAEIAKGIVAIVDRLAKKAAKAHVLLCSIVRGGSPDDPLRQKAERVNAMTRALGQRANVHLIGMPARFYLPDGRANTELMRSDFVHFSAAGYQAWAELLAPLIGELLAAKPAADRRESMVQASHGTEQ